MAALLVNVAGIAVTLACWIWARDRPHGDLLNNLLIWVSPLLAFPITLVGRKILNARPVVERARWVTTPVHYAMMIALGCGIFPAVEHFRRSPDVAIPVPNEILLAMVYITGFATMLTVLNLALRGFGAPFAAKLSSRLATDWMYAWTRNPMLLCTLVFLFSLALWFQSMWCLVWVAVSVSPGWIFFVKLYEERELEIRFGSSYLQYKSRTPLLWPGRPHPAIPAQKETRALS